MCKNIFNVSVVFKQLLFYIAWLGYWGDGKGSTLR